MKMSKQIAKVVLCIDNKNNYIEKVRKKIEGTTGFVYGIIKELKKIGIIEDTFCHNKRKYFILTDKGKMLQMEINRLKNLLS